jgi:hypothetical protein
MVPWLLIANFTSSYCRNSLTGFQLVVLEAEKAQKGRGHSREEGVRLVRNPGQKELIFEPRIELGTFSVLD